jgi:hypothetical protein
MVIFSLAFEGDRKIEEYIKLAYLSDNLGFYSFQIYEHLPFKPAIPISFIIANYTKKLKLDQLQFQYSYTILYNFQDIFLS